MTSSNEIESAMTAVTSFSLNNTSVLLRKMKKLNKSQLSSLEPIKDLSINDNDLLSNDSMSQQQQQNDSLLSFEHHELTQLSQCTPSMLNSFKPNSTPLNNKSNSLKSYFDNLTSNASVINSNDNLDEENELVSDFNNNNNNNLKNNDTYCCVYCSRFYTTRESSFRLNESYFIDLNGNKIRNDRNLKDLYLSFKKNSIKSIFILENFRF